MKNITTLLSIITITTFTFVACAGGVQTVRTAESSNSTIASTNNSDIINNATSEITGGVTTTESSLDTGSTLTATMIAAVPSVIASLTSLIGKSTLSSTAENNCSNGQCTGGNCGKGGTGTSSNKNVATNNANTGSPTSGGASSILNSNNGSFISTSSDLNNLFNNGLANGGERRISVDQSVISSLSNSTGSSPTVTTTADGSLQINTSSLEASTNNFTLASMILNPTSSSFNPSSSLAWPTILGTDQFLSMAQNCDKYQSTSSPFITTNPSTQQNQSESRSTVDSIPSGETRTVTIIGGAPTVNVPLDEAYKYSNGAFFGVGSPTE